MQQGMVVQSLLELAPSKQRSQLTLSAKSPPVRANSPTKRLLLPLNVLELLQQEAHVPSTLLSQPLVKTMLVMLLTEARRHRLAP